MNDITAPSSMPPVSPGPMPSPRDGSTARATAASSPPRLAAKLPPEQHFLLHGIDWATYVAMGDLLMNRQVRMAYDGENLELMTLSPEHGRYDHRLNSLIVMLTTELDIEIAGFGSMTCRRTGMERGLDPDDCYWIAKEPAVRGRTDIDLDTDPPPDLVTEVEVSRSLVERLPILAALGVPEVWRWDGTTLRVLHLQSDGTYVEKDHSLAFPFLPMAEFARFLVIDPTQGETKHLRAFCAWVREHAASWRPQSSGR